MNHPLLQIKLIFFLIIIGISVEIWVLTSSLLFNPISTTTKSSRNKLDSLGLSNEDSDVMEEIMSEYDENGPFVEKIIFALVDALDYEFVIEKKNGSPKPYHNKFTVYTEHSKRNDTTIAQYKFMAEHPAITGLRVKALAMGNIPFVEYAVNIANTEVYRNISHFLFSVGCL